jgi:uncharacterized protein
LNPPTSWPLGKKKQADSIGGRNEVAAPEPTAVSGRWVVGALILVVLLAAICGYATLGLLFYQGQWQFILHPAKTITAMPRTKFDEIHFDDTETGLAQLDGWWIPADAGARWSGDTILYLHGGRGSLSNAVSDLDALHGLGINVFAFDYRGYGKSAGPHPDEARMNADADAAWSYLTGMRHENAKSIVVYGAGLGASLAAELAARHTPAGVVLDAPSETARKITSEDGRSKLLPMWLLLDERFDAVSTLRTLTVPKLFLDRDGGKARTEELYRAADSPKQYFELKRDDGYSATLTRFLDGVLR